MVQKTDQAAPRRRGRPRAYDPEQALRRAIEVFWKKGFAATTLDDIAVATGMNRPSLYAAFGDKHALYVQALTYYHRRSAAEMREIFAGHGPLDVTLMGIYDAALALFFSGGHGRGCFSIGTATTEAADDPDVRAILAESTRRVDAGFEQRIHAAQQAGEISTQADPAALARLASATLHTIAIRARAGISRTELRCLAEKATAVICGGIGRNRPNHRGTSQADRA